MSNKVEFNVSDLVSDLHKLYKDKKSQDMITTGNTIIQTYTAKDGSPVSPGHPISELLGLPCLPYNKIVQISGPPDSGKSTCSGELMAAAQKAGHLVILWDSEGKFDARRFDTKFGGDSSKLAVIMTNEILQGGEKVRKFVIAAKERQPNVKVLIVWDSVGGSQARGAAERELDNEKHGQPGQDAKENGAVMKMVVGLTNKYPNSIALLLINQIYAKIGFMQQGDTESGGKKVEYHSSYIIRLKKIKSLTRTIKGREYKYGIKTRATVVKHHLSQSEMSLHKLDFNITADGATISEEQSADDKE